MSVVEVVRDFFQQRAPEVRRPLVAVSGGLDSTALLLALQEAGSPEMIACHVNHHLRGGDSDADQQFVEALCSHLGIPLEVRHVELNADEAKQRGIEAAARTARYDALRDAARAVNADAIATAHHRDDQSETVLMRLLSGSGPLRLGGVRERNGDLVRPLLTVGRAELEAFVATRGIVAREDAMNADARFLRTRIRRELLPLARTINPRVDAALEETARQVAELERDLDSATERLVSVSRSESSTTFDAARLDGLEFMLRRLLHREIVRLDASARDVDAGDLRRLAASRVSRETISASLEIVRERSVWTIRQQREEAAVPPYAIAIRPGEEFPLPGSHVRFSLTVSADPVSTSRRGRSQLFEVTDAECHFEVRNRRSGDRFHPLGAPAAKSLNDFLIDRKIPRQQRDTIPLLTCNGEVVWVAGVEVSEKFKVRGNVTRRFRAELIDDQAGLHGTADCAAGR